MVSGHTVLVEPALATWSPSGPQLLPHGLMDFQWLPRGSSTCVESSHVTCPQRLRKFIGIIRIYMILYLFIYIYIYMYICYIDSHGVGFNKYDKMYHICYQYLAYLR